MDRDQTSTRTKRGNAGKRGGTPARLGVHDTRRRFEQWARNPSCEANGLAAVFNVPMAEVLRREDPTAEPTMGQSPFAIARGQSFEKRLLDDKALRLREALVAAGVLPPSASGFLDLRVVGGPMPDLRAAQAETEALLRRLASGPIGEVPCLVAAATVCVPGRLMVPEALLVIDALVIRCDLRPARLAVVEIKTYPDRGGYTDRVELATARAQAGVYVHGLDLVLQTLGIRPDQVEVSRQGVLVLTKPGSNRPSVRPHEDLRYQSERARIGFARLREFAARLGEVDAADEAACLDLVLQADTAYSEHCHAFCDRAPICFRRAQQAKDAVILGEEAGRALAGVSIDRALELMNGAPALNPAERDLQRRLCEEEVADVAG